MNKLPKIFAGLLSVAVLALSSCSRDEDTGAMTCTGRLYGLSVGASYTDAIDSRPRPVALISQTDGSISSVASVRNGSHSMKGAYNTGDDCYYVFQSAYYNTRLDTLYKVAMSGVTTSYSLATSDSVSSGSLVYSRVANKLYCIQQTTTAHKISEVVMSGSTFSLIPLANTLHPFDGFNVTVDNGTGDLYYQTYTGAEFVIEKYRPGGAGPAVVCSLGIERVWGLSFNMNDNKLYSIKGSNASDFVSITTTGTITTVSRPGFPIDAKFYSACINPCNNRFIISNIDFTTNICHLYQLNMSGAMVSHITSGSGWQGLDVKY